MIRQRSTALLFVSGVVQLVGMLITAGGLMSGDLMNPFLQFSDPLIARLSNPELTLVLGTTVYLLSTVLLIAVLETRMIARNLSARMSLLGTLPVVGVVLGFLTPPGKAAVTPAPKAEADVQLVPAGAAMGLTAVMGILGIYFTTQIGEPNDISTSLSAAEANLEAYSAIKDIQEAQNSYKLKDWDDDGEKEFALFAVHLWRTGRRGKDPIDVNLIPEQLAVARVEELAFRSYSFRNLHYAEQEPADSPSALQYDESRLRKLNYREQWALVSEPHRVPEENEKSQSLRFLAFSDGRIFAQPTESANLVTSVPFRYEKDWSLVSSKADIKRLQAKDAR